MDIQYIVGIILALIGYIIYSDGKRKSAEALLENLETKKKLNEGDKEIAKNEGLEQSEEEYREFLKKAAEKEKDKEKSLEELKDQFNKPSDS